MTSMCSKNSRKFLHNLEMVLTHCGEIHLVLNWEKFHFMFKEGIILGHKVSNIDLKMDQENIKVIEKLPPPSNIEGIRSFLDQTGFYRIILKDFFKITKLLCKLMQRDVLYVLIIQCEKAFKML